MIITASIPATSAASPQPEVLGASHTSGPGVLVGVGVAPGTGVDVGVGVGGTGVGAPGTGVRGLEGFLVPVAPS